jgi:hypothetical protein
LTSRNRRGRTARSLETHRQLYLSNWPFASADVMLKVRSADTKKRADRTTKAENFMVTAGATKDEYFSPNLSGLQYNEMVDG